MRKNHFAPEWVAYFVSGIVAYYAAEYPVENSIAIQPDLAVPLIAKTFGFSRVTEDMKNEILTAIEASIGQSIVETDGEFLKLHTVK